MGKYDNLKVLKKTKARVAHVCSKCGADISKGDQYYREDIQDRFLHSLNARQYCFPCFEKDGDALLKNR